MNLLSALRVTRELRPWAAALLLLGVAGAPLVHARGHRLDHVHAGDAPGEGHGKHDPLHLAVTLVDPPPPPAIVPVADREELALPAQPEAPDVFRFQVSPLTPQGP